MQTALTTLASIPFATAVCALIKRRWPAVTGGITPCVMLACTALAAVLGHYSAQIPAYAWEYAGPILAAVVAMGLHQTATAAIDRANPAAPEPPPTIAARPATADELADAVLASLDRTPPPAPSA